MTPTRIAAALRDLFVGGAVGVYDQESARRWHIAESAIRRAFYALAETADREVRARLLLDCSTAAAVRASHGQAAFGPGYDSTADLESAVLYEALASVETAPDWPSRQTLQISADERTHEYITIVEIHAGGILDRMWRHPDPAVRARLLDEIYTTLHPYLTGQACEILAHLPAPGWIGWAETSTADRYFDKVMGRVERAAAWFTPGRWRR